MPEQPHEWTAADIEAMERGELPARFAPLETNIADAYMPQIERALILETLDLMREVLHKAAGIGRLVQGVQTYDRFFPSDDEDNNLYDALSNASGLEAVSDFAHAIAYFFVPDGANLTRTGIEAFAADYPDLPEVAEALADLTRPVVDPPGYLEWIAQGRPEVSK